MSVTKKLFSEKKKKTNRIQKKTSPFSCPLLCLTTDRQMINRKVLVETSSFLRTEELRKEKVSAAETVLLNSK